MRIAQVSPLYESVPPQLYGGTERVVSYLTEALVDMGHDVTLFASGDSQTSAYLVPCCEKALRLDGTSIDPLSRHIFQLEQVLRENDKRPFDVIHWHTDNLSWPIQRRIRTASVTTLHGRLDLPDLEPLFREFNDIPVVSISDAQRAPARHLNWQRTVYHGVPAHLYRFRAEPGDYLAFLGRISPEKRVDRAIEIAQRAGIPLKIAAKIDKADREYYERIIAPKMKSPLVEYIGEIGEHEKSEFLGGAKALLFPIDWPEPFGLVMIEAMACGTPVIAYPHGSVPEVVEHGRTGFIVNSIEEAVRAVERLGELDRCHCRQRFEERFTVERMAAEYVEVYRGLLSERRLVSRADDLYVRSWRNTSLTDPFFTPAA